MVWFLNAICICMHERQIRSCLAMVPQVQLSTNCRTGFQYNEDKICTLINLSIPQLVDNCTYNTIAFPYTKSSLALTKEISFATDTYLQVKHNLTPKPNYHDLQFWKLVLTGLVLTSLVLSSDGRGGQTKVRPRDGFLQTTRIFCSRSDFRIVCDIAVGRDLHHNLWWQQLRRPALKINL